MKCLGEKDSLFCLVYGNMFENVTLKYYSTYEGTEVFRDFSTAGSIFTAAVEIEPAVLK